jgi:putative hemolysin
MTTVLQLLIIGVMVAFNALYVAAEFATVGSRRSRVQETAEGGSRPARRLLDILQDPHRLDSYVATCQIGITLSSLVAGAYGQSQLTPLLEPVFGSVGGRGLAIVVVLIFITTLQVVLGELLPKTAALRYPEKLAMVTLPPMRVSQWLFRPLVTIFNGSAFRLMRAMRLSVDHSHAHVHSPEELARLYQDSAAGGLIDAAERDMLAGILNVDARLVREIMTPRTRLVTVSASTPVRDVVGRSPHAFSGDR